MKKFYAIFSLLFIIYAAAASYYLLQLHPGDVPIAYQGGPGDPSTFMSEKELMKIHAYSIIQYFTFFLTTPLDFLLLLILMHISARFRKWAEMISGKSFFQLSLYYFLLNLLVSILSFPLEYFLFQLDHSFGLSNQSIHSWFTDMLKTFALDTVFTIPFLWLFYWIMKKSPLRWWLWFSALSVPIIISLTFIAPIVISPMFNEFKPLQDKELKSEISVLAEKANIPHARIYEINMSKQTNAINAYVTGIGGSARIVLGDNARKEMKKDEILFVMAHEMGHYVQKHIYWGLLTSIAASFILLWATFHLYRFCIRRWGHIWGIRGQHDIAALPLLLLIFSVLSFLITPLENVQSRYFERQSDEYAMKLTQNAEAGIRAFQKLSKASLVDVNPPAPIQFFLGSHPTLIERIEFIEDYHK